MPRPAAKVFAEWILLLAPRFRCRVPKGGREKGRSRSRFRPDFGALERRVEERCDLANGWSDEAPAVLSHPIGLDRQSLSGIIRSGIDLDGHVLESIHASKLMSS